MAKPIRLNYTPRAWQKRCHLERKRFTVLALHRRAGKTFMAVMELIDKAMRCTLERPDFYYVAPQLKQAVSLSWRMLKAQVEPLRVAGVCDVREGDLTVAFKHNGATIHLYGGDNPDAMRGVRMDGVVIDEVAQIKPEVWVDIIQPALSDRLGWALFIGTPKGVNLFSELFYAAADKPEWHAARFTVYDTDALDAAEVERLRAEMPENSFAREYLCDFAASGDEQVLSLTDAEDSSRRVYTERDICEAPRIIGVDPARFGGDRSVICKRQGLQCFTMQVHNGIDNMALASRVAQEIEEWKPDAVFIDSGAGAGIIDRLRQLGYQPIEVPFGGKAANERLYANKRAEMWFLMADWIRAGGCIPNDALLKQELATPIYWFDKSERKVLESKDEIKKRLKSGASPDLADGLALTFAFPVARRTPLQEVQAQYRSRERRDPLDTV